VPHFDRELVVFSHQVGMSKPNKEIYLLAAKRAGVEPSQCVFLDDEAKHAKGALDAGFAEGIVVENDKATLCPKKDVVEMLRQRIAGARVPAAVAVDAPSSAARVAAVVAVVVAAAAIACAVGYLRRPRAFAGQPR
jgi:hypothetical protein